MQSNEKKFFLKKEELVLRPGYKDVGRGKRASFQQL